MMWINNRQVLGSLKHPLTSQPLIYLKSTIVCSSRRKTPHQCLCKLTKDSSTAVKRPKLVGKSANSISETMTTILTVALMVERLQFTTCMNLARLYQMQGAATKTRCSQILTSLMPCLCHSSRSTSRLRKGGALSR